MVDQYSRQITKEIDLYKAMINYQPTQCPFCTHRTEFQVPTQRWKCTNRKCGFDYSRNSCHELGKIYDSAVRGINNPHLFEVLANSQDNLHIMKL